MSWPCERNWLYSETREKSAVCSKSDCVLDSISHNTMFPKALLLLHCCPAPSLIIYSLLFISKTAEVLISCVDLGWSFSAISHSFGLISAPQWRQP